MYLVVFERASEYRGLVITHRGEQVTRVVSRPTREALVALVDQAHVLERCETLDPFHPTFTVLDASDGVPPDLAREFGFLWGSLFERSTT
jgi:hypothetical protein